MCVSGAIPGRGGRARLVVGDVTRLLLVPLTPPHTLPAQVRGVAILHTSHPLFSLSTSMTGYVEGMDDILDSRNGTPG